MSNSDFSLNSQIENRAPLNNLTSHISTSYIKWETRNGKWETRSGKWEIRNLEVGYGKGLNWAPRNGKWEPNQNSRLWRFALCSVIWLKSDSQGKDLNGTFQNCPIILKAWHTHSGGKLDLSLSVVRSRSLTFLLSFHQKWSSRPTGDKAGQNSATAAKFINSDLQYSYLNCLCQHLVWKSSFLLSCDL